LNLAHESQRMEYESQRMEYESQRMEYGNQRKKENLLSVSLFSITFVPHKERMMIS